MDSPTETPRSDAPRSRSRRHLKRLLLVAGGVATLAAGALVGRGALERQRWQEFCAEQAALSARLATPAAPIVRVVDVTEPGDAWESYRAAALSIETAARGIHFRPRKPRRLDSPLGDLVRLSGLDTAEEDILQGSSITLMHLRATSRRKWVEVPGRESPFSDSRHAARASALLLQSGHRFAQAWDPASAIDDLAAALQLDLDLYGSIRSFVACEELQQLVLAQHLPEPLLRRIEDLAQRLESAIEGLGPMLRPVRAQLAEFIGPGSRLVLPAQYAVPPGRVWRNSFSVKLAVCEADRRAADLIRMAPEIERMEWERADQKLREWSARAGEASTNPVVQEIETSAADTERYLRHLRWYYRMLRTAAMWKRGLGPGAPGWPVDPWKFLPLQRSDEPV